MLGSRRIPAETALDLREKGMPAVGLSLQPSATGAQNWRLLQEDLPLPVAVLKESALRHNSAWMKAF
jgi:D-serine dehydratase